MDISKLHIDISTINRSLIPTATKATANSGTTAETNTVSTAMRQDNFISNRVRYSSSDGFATNRPWEWDNSVDATVNHLWQTETSFWGSEQTKGLSKAEYLAHKQDNAAAYSIDWDTLLTNLGINEKILSGEQAPIRYEGSFGFGEDHAAADYFAARYISMREQITTHYRGDELTDNLAKLDQYFDVAVDRYAEARADLLDSGLSNYGVAGEREKIKTSYLALYDKAKEDYAQFIVGNKNYARVGGTEYEWLSNNDRFMAASLQHAYQASEGSDESTVEDVYSAKELHTMGIVLDELKRDEKNASVGSEEAIGVQIGQTALKTMAAVNAAGDHLHTLMNGLIGGFTIRVMDRADQRISELREMAEKPFQGDEWAVDHRNEPFTDRQAVLNIVNTILTASKSGKPIVGSLSVGVQAAKASFSERQKLDLYAMAARYGSDSGGGMDDFLRHYNQIDKSDKTNVNYLPMSQHEKFEYGVAAFQARLSGEIPAFHFIGEKVNLLA